MALRTVYKDHFLSFEEFLSKDKSVTVHPRNRQILATETYKILNGLSTCIKQGIFKAKTDSYNIRNSSIFPSRNIKTDMDYTPSLIWVQRLRTLIPNR